LGGKAGLSVLVSVSELFRHGKVKESGIYQFFFNLRRILMIDLRRSIPKNRLKIALIGLLVLGFFVPAVSGYDKVNINTADKEQLVTLKYIGDALADRIIEYRQNQPFQVSEDIMKVKGVGEKTFETNKERIIVKDE
jgi:competence protein ComEA